MNGYDHVRALLYAYPMAERLAEAVKEGARVRACLSFRSPRNTLSVMESIAADVEYAECLLEWKSRLDRVLSHCSDEELFLLEYKYFRRRKQLKAWEERVALSCSERSYFRKQKEVLERVSRRLVRRGGTREAFLKDFEGFPRSCASSPRSKAGRNAGSSNSAGAGTFSKIRTLPLPRRRRALCGRAARRRRWRQRRGCPR